MWCTCVRSDSNCQETTQTNNPLWSVCKRGKTFLVNYKNLSFVFACFSVCLRRISLNLNHWTLIKTQCFETNFISLLITGIWGKYCLPILRLYLAKHKESSDWLQLVTMHSRHMEAYTHWSIATISSTRLILILGFHGGNPKQIVQLTLRRTYEGA